MRFFSFRNGCQVERQPTDCVKDVTLLSIEDCQKAQIPSIFQTAKYRSLKLVRHLHEASVTGLIMSHLKVVCCVSNSMYDTYHTRWGLILKENIQAANISIPFNSYDFFFYFYSICVPLFVTKCVD